MKKIKAVIVEDSRLARNELKELIKNHPEIEIIGEAENVDLHAGYPTIAPCFSYGRQALVGQKRDRSAMQYQRAVP